MNLFSVAVLLSFCLAVHPQDLVGSGAGDPPPSATEVADKPAPVVAQKVEIDPVNSDDEIADRIEEILQATGWFDDPRANVDRGVVFLTGTSDTAAHRQWAEQTVMNTSDVVAVVNKLKVAQRPFWNVEPALDSLTELARETTELLPLLCIALIVGVAFYFIARLGAMLTRRLAKRHVASQLLREVSGNIIGVLLFLVGVYIALRVSGLTRLAVTLLGGTGLVGLALGFAFRDIAENYLASILISINHPFRVGDLIEIDSSKGFVRKVTMRGTILNTLEGNEIQIPNSIVYKNKILNYTATPLTRIDFGLGIGFDDSITEAQSQIMMVLGDHPAVAKDPAPLALVDSLGSATVNMKVLYWIDQTLHSKPKVSSSIIRLVKHQLMASGISMPDEARELIFPQGVPITLRDGSKEFTERLQSPTISPPPTSPSRPASLETLDTASVGEGDLTNEQEEVQRVTSSSPTNDETNLLDNEPTR